MSDESQNLVTRDLLLVTSVRFLENQYGRGAIKALVEWKQKHTKQQWEKRAASTGREDPEYLFRLFNDKVHDYKVLQKNPKTLEVKVFQCKHAETCKRLNATDIGYEMICKGDYAVVEGYNPDITFTRSKCLMKGDESCHFIFKLNKEDS